MQKAKIINEGVDCLTCIFVPQASTSHKSCLPYKFSYATFKWKQLILGVGVG